jgi:capsular polysaccharide biosynthesis protein
MPSGSRLSRLRQIEGEEELERQLTREFDAEIIYPETLSFAAQIEKLSRAGHVIGCEGSAFHSLIFLRQVPQAIVLSNSLPHMDYLLCDELFDGETAYIRATNEAAELKDRSHWTIDIPRVLRSVGRLLDQSPTKSPSLTATPGSWRARATNLVKPWIR